MRSRFQLEIPKFVLREMKSSVGVKESVERIVARVIRWHGTAIATKSHPLLADLRESIYSDQVVTPANSGYRILPERRRAVLQRTLEVGLQTITQLPSRYPVVPSPRKQLKSAATAFVKAADLAVAAIGQQEIRIGLHCISRKMTRAEESCCEASTRCGGMRKRSKRSPS